MAFGSKEFSVVFKARDEISRTVKGVDSKFGGLTSTLKRLMPMIGVAGIAGGFAKIVTSTAQAGDEVAKMSQKVGVAVETLSAYKHVAELSGITLDTVAVGLRRFAQNSLDMSRGLGEARREFKDLGIQVTDANGNVREMEDLILEVADRFSKMEDGTVKTAMAMRLFGRSGAEMIPMLNKGSAGIKEMTDEARALGLVFSEKSAKACEDFNDSMTRLKGTLRGLTQDIGNMVIPAMTDMMSMILRLRDIETAIPKYKMLQGSIAEYENEITKLTKALEKEEVQEWKNENKIDDLNAQLENAQYWLSERKKELEGLTKAEKTYQDTMGGGGGDTGAKAAAAANQRYRNEIDKATKSDRERLEIWRQEQLAIEGVDAVLMNHVVKIREETIAQTELAAVMKEQEETALRAAQAEEERQEKLQTQWLALHDMGRDYHEVLEETADATTTIGDNAGMTANVISGRMGSAISQVTVGGQQMGMAMKGVMSSLIADLIQATVKALALKAVMATIGGGGGFLGSLFHEGDMVKHTGGMIQKAHTGLMLRPDERHIIAQTGEGILSRKGVASIGGPATVDAINRGEINFMMNANFGGIHNMADAGAMAEVMGRQILTAIREAA